MTMGFCVYPALATATSTSFIRIDADGGRLMTGNAMHMASVTTVVAVALASVQLVSA